MKLILVLEAFTGLPFLVFCVLHFISLQLALCCRILSLLQSGNIYLDLITICLKDISVCFHNVYIQNSFLQITYVSRSQSFEEQLVIKLHETGAGNPY